MDDPKNVAPGRVGPAITGIEMRLGDNDEIVVRGPNVFPGYWNRPQQTAEVLRDGWFHSPATRARWMPRATGVLLGESRI